MKLSLEARGISLNRKPTSTCAVNASLRRKWTTIMPLRTPKMTTYYMSISNAMSAAVSPYAALGSNALLVTMSTFVSSALTRDY